MAIFQLVTPLKPEGDQPQAIRGLADSLRAGHKHQTLLGVTGSGKTFTMANVIAATGKPALVISPNKTLAAQFYSELKALFPRNAVEYFISYYDYYQPEAYVPQTDTYIEKDSSVNDDIDRLRLSATSALMMREDVIIVASVSCIYNLGAPEDYRQLMVFAEVGQRVRREELMSWLVGIHYTRNEIEFRRGTFRVKGDVLDIFPAYRQTAVRIELEGGQVARIREISPLTGETIIELRKVGIYPAKHFVTTTDHIKRALTEIEAELNMRHEELRQAGKLLEAQRLLSRTKYDMEMLKEIGFCHGVENYSRHLAGRAPGSRPSCLIDYFPRPFLTIIDESHVTVPQLRGMYEGDRSRKETLVEYGFRLPSALDNRPLKFEEFGQITEQTVYLSATPSAYELQQSRPHVFEQLLRPTGIIDPEITVRPAEGQIDDLLERVRVRAERKERVLVTTLTKRLSEDLSRYLAELGLRVQYLHSDVGALERVQILRDLRKGHFDCLIGINLLREGLDLPEVSLVAILDADKEGFLRSATALIQTAGRAARHVGGEVVLYADHVTAAMQHLLDETQRRRAKQMAFNHEHGITPRTIEKAINDDLQVTEEAQELIAGQVGETTDEFAKEEALADLQREMEAAARNLNFELAAYLRDQMKLLKGEPVSLASPVMRAQGSKDRSTRSMRALRGARSKRQ